MKTIVRRLGLILIAFLLLALFGPAIGKSCLHALTPHATLTAWRAEVKRLDSLFPREPVNEARRLELLRKLRRRGIRLDEGIIEEIDHHITPCTIAVKIGWQWQELFGWR
ncbi:MAG: hypothetical protein HS117_20225 [Verrucomicrobiaceae bacterium]|jgi:hypothetical protein|nr:hypothetical protein [Verrucomicrobiaceae bacterium]